MVKKVCPERGFKSKEVVPVAGIGQALEVDLSVVIDCHPSEGIHTPKQELSITSLTLSRTMAEISKSVLVVNAKHNIKESSEKEGKMNVSLRSSKVDAPRSY